ncbi:MAG: DsbA family protein [Alphaproteobacteria bacterium]
MRQNFKKITLATALCAATMFGGYTHAQAAEFTDAQKQEMQTIIKDFLMDNPQVIIDAVEKYRTDQEEQMTKNAKENLASYKDSFMADHLPVAGNPKGDITVVEFFDYNCGYCRKAFEDIRKLIKTDENLRVVFQEMPILSPSSKTMAQMALAAHNQGKYFEMHTALMDYRGNQSDAAYYKLAADIGLDVAQLKSDMASESVAAALGKSTDIARKLGIRGTPGFIIGNEIYPGYIGLDGMKDAIADARKAASK